MRFASRLAANTGAQEELRSYGLQLENSLIQIKGRLFHPEVKVIISTDIVRIDGFISFIIHGHLPTTNVAS